MRSRAQRRDPLLPRLILWLCVSLCLHVLGAVLLWPFWSWLSEPPDDETPPVRMVVIVPPEEEEEEQEDPELEWDGQIVDVAPPEIEERPLDAEYLAEHDQTVEEETRIEQYRINPEVLSPEFSREDKVQLQDLMDIGATEQSTGAKVGNERFDPDRDGRLASLPSPYNLTNRDGLQAPMMSSSNQQSLAGSPNNDLVQEQLGDRLQLNTKEFLYASYINQIKRLVNFYWQQNLDNLGGRLTLAKPSYTTVVSISLAADGSLEDVQVQRECGAGLLDQAVIQAFHLAGPFPPPPAGLVERDGLAYLDKLGFTVNVGQGTSPFMGVDPRAGVQYPGLMKSPR